MTDLSADPITSIVSPFFAGAEAGQLRLPHCDSCGAWHWYPKPVCPECGAEWQWADVGPRVAVASWVTVHRDLTTSGARHRSTPYCLVLVEPIGAPGVRLIVPTAVSPEEAQRLSVGAPGSLAFSRVPGTGRKWPVFRRSPQS